MKKLLLNAKFRLIASILLFAVSITMASAATIAFFTDARQSTGVFTAGNVYVELTEAAVKPDRYGNLVEDTERDRIYGAELSDETSVVLHDYGIVFPGQTIHKDPIVKNVGSESAWIAVKVIIEDGNGDIHRLFGYNDQTNEIDIELLITGGLLDEHVHVGLWNNISGVCHNDNYAMVQVADRRSGKYEFYFFIANTLGSGDSVEIFDTVVIDPFFGNAEMQEFRELKVTVQAFAVQKYGFDNCFEAMKRAFSKHFSAFTTE